jgi:hypothetical protein
LQVTIDDFFLPEDNGSTSAPASALSLLLRAGRDGGEPDPRTWRQSDARKPVFGRLMRSGLLRDPELMAELMARVRQDADRAWRCRCTRPTIPSGPA